MTVVVCIGNMSTILSAILNAEHIASEFCLQYIWANYKVSGYNLTVICIGLILVA